MKYLIKSLVVLLSAIAMTHKAYANEINVSEYETAPGQAGVLVTQPATINNNAGNTIDQTNRLEQISNSIPSVHNQPSPSINPIEFLKNPSASIKQFLRSSPNQTPQPVDPLGVSKRPPLDSEVRGSISVPVTHF
ncbi:MAG: hypothetical protein DSM106950_42315 [Stigonema ocellatum SAG 48.90 = DSM 106950]|nr:hypothetical protein [Stigonema ocellatum SAG 48.90 = DSM 106950]